VEKEALPPSELVRSLKESGYFLYLESERKVILKWMLKSGLRV
jgi:hypothetical protein